MSAHQGNSPCYISVDPPTADVLRLETKKVLMFNHEPFEDYLEYTPRRQLALANIYRDATAVIDALYWDPAMAPHTSDFEVPVTSGYIQQLHIRRCDLLDTNLDLLSDIGADNHTNALIMVDIHTNRHSVEALNRVFDTYSDTITT
jgi:hypothetical protein